jgi:molybdenum cofactor cytidylyltransferase
MTLALIPAAGNSRRMGRPKLALPLGDGTVLSHAIGALRQAGVEQILVVVGAHVSELVPLALAAGAAALLLPEATSGMRATIELGLSWLETRFHPADTDTWLLLPADHPSLHPGIIAQLLHAHATSPHCSIAVPTFQGRRGHPVLLHWEHVARLRRFPANLGLNVYLRQHTDVTLEVPVDSASILADLDTPEDYAKLVSGEW